ncbi:ATP-binding cassette domain-containing protein [Rhodococcus sp. 3Y1]
MAAEPAMQASSLYRFYRAGDEETLALQGVSVTASRGEFIVVAGPSGSGKSTLLACLAGMDDPDGEVCASPASGSATNLRPCRHEYAPVMSGCSSRTQISSNT